MNPTHDAATLTALRDIHTPPAISDWPPALGWIVLAALSLGALFAICLWVWRWYRNGHLQRQSLKKLRTIQQQFEQHKNALRSCRAIALLLRRMAIAKFGKARVAQLYGEAWIGFLNQQQSDYFTGNTAKLLMQAPYRARFDADFDAQACEHLFSATRTWIKHHV